ncbi:MAG: NAD(P)/FAD-dependent oxidoreductase [Chitinophagaceae bacterium]
MKTYDSIIIGGGLAGLSLSILLAKQGYSVLVLEKKTYPFHKVCGEYISNESFAFLQTLGIDLAEAVPINKLVLSHNKTQIKENLDLGGIGISRYNIDAQLAKQAKQNGVHLLEGTTCMGYEKKENCFIVKTNNENFQSEILCASFGRYSFNTFYPNKSKKSKWLAVKYHVKGNFDASNISLHAFKEGYCGFSKIEKDNYCLCYMTTSNQLQAYQNNISNLEKNVLYKNKFLKNIFENSQSQFEKPITISNIVFKPKKAVFDGVFYLGDSAGSIAPLTGNGMSNALRSAYELNKILSMYLNKQISIAQAKHKYVKIWNIMFKHRIYFGSLLQIFFCIPILTILFFYIAKRSAWLRKTLIRLSHGKPFG